MSGKITESKTDVQNRVRLDSKKYYFLVDGTMPVLDLELKSRVGPPAKDPSKTSKTEQQKLTIELFAPISGEIFEARTPRGRIEADNDGTITYFSNNSDSVTFSLFLGKSLTVTMNRKTGIVIIKTPSKITTIFDERSSLHPEKKIKDGLQSDQLRLELD